MKEICFVYENGPTLGVAKTGQVFARRGIGWKESLLQCSLLVAVLLLAGVGGSPVQPDSGLGRWLERQIPEVGDQNDQLIPIEVNDEQVRSVKGVCLKMTSCSRTEVPNLFLVRGTLTNLCSYLAASLDGQIGVKIKELY